jgi:glycyl-tRNA synthetase
MITVTSPADYFNFLRQQGILLDPTERRQAIVQQIQALAKQVNGSIPDDLALLEEVTNLVEAPTALCGAFDPAHLKLPREVLISVMRKHQRYFPIVSRAADQQEVLLPHFIAVRNGNHEGLELVIEGNEHVIRARFSDADFFVREDRKRSLDAYLPRLATLTFQTRLGSMLDKVHRLEALVVDLAPLLGLSAAELETARRAAGLSKADLATHMVVEMTSLQGVIGRYYALDSGETSAVAQAIFEHYLPRYTGDQVPAARPGLTVGLADRLDTLVGLFAAGLAPSGNKDPFAQRRAALGLVQGLIAWDINFDLHTALQAAAAHLPISSSPENQAAVLEFIVERLRFVFLEQGYRYDVVDGVLAAQGDNPAGAMRAVKALSQWVARPDWSSILPAYARCVRITRDLKQTFSLNPAAFKEPQEADLYQALQAAQASQRDPGSVDDMLHAFTPMIPTINSYFDTVLVMAEDAVLRTNRLGQLQRIVALANGVVDFSRLEGF